MAFLLDDRSDRIVQYEQQAGLPRLESAIGFGLVFDEPVEALFAGVSESMRDQLAVRARVLLQQMSDKTTADNAQKLDTLTRLGNLDDDTWRGAA
jgi:hypothetical protein